MSKLSFTSINITNFKTFVGEHTLKLAQSPGLYYIAGANKVAPELGANGVGKSTIWDALTWVLWGRTGRDNRPANAVKPWKKGKGQTSVALHFHSHGWAHTLIRTRSPNQLLLIEGGDEDEELEPREIQQDQVPKLLGMTEEMFRRTLVLGQFGTLFLDLKPEAQAQMFTEALGLDVWLRAIDVAGEQAKGAQRAADQAASNMQANEAALATIATEIAEATELAETFATDQAQRYRKADRGVTTLEKDLAAAQAEVPERPELPDNSHIDLLRDALATAKDAQRDADTAVTANAEARAADQRALAALNKPKPTCGECGQVLPAKAAAKSVTELQESIRKRTAIEKSLVRTQQQAQQAVLDAQTVVTNAKEEYEECKASYTERQHTYDKAIRKVASIQGELKVWKADRDKIQAETNVALETVQRLKTRRQLMRATGTQLKGQRDAALAAVEEAKFWQDGFREIRLSIIDQTLVELEMATSRHAAMLGLHEWGVKFDTSRETKAGTVSYAFSVLLYPPGQEEPVKWESYSGGESQRWQLATAFALSEVLLARAGIAPNIEVLDEPTRGLSAGGVSDLLDHLRDRAVELGRAIYFVDHHSLDKGAFDGTLVVTKGRKGSTFAWQ